MNKTKPTRTRLGVAVLVFCAVVISYMDRGNLGLAAPTLARDLHLSRVQLGLVFSAFGWAYAAGQLPGGWWVDRLAPRFLFPIIMCGWSLLTCAVGLASGFAGVFGLRFGMGIFEAPSAPASNRVVTSWFPEQERARAISFYTSGQFVGLAFVAPVLLWVQGRFGWRAVFFATGGAGLAFSLLWWRWYRDPRESARTNAEEVELIEQGGGLTDGAKTDRPTRVEWRQVKAILSNRNLWGVIIGHVCVGATQWFFLTWFPTYLAEYRHMSAAKMGFAVSLPFLAAFAGVLFSGWVSDWFVRRGMDVASARKLPVVCGLLLSVSIVGANFVDSASWAVAFMALAFFGNGLASIGWTFISALAPAGLIGLTGSIYNFIGQVSASCVPIAIGYLVRGGSFAPAMWFMGLIALAGVLAYLFMVKNVTRITVPSDP